MRQSRWITVALLMFALNSCGRLQAVERPDGQTESGLTVTELITGVDSRLKPNQWARIADEETWQRVITAHVGEIIESGNADIIEIDFSTSMVIAIVDAAPRKSTGIHVDRVWIDDEIVFLDYRWVDQPDARRNRQADNVFGFVVIPRSTRQMVVRRQKTGKATVGEFQEVARFPACGSKQELAVEAAAVVDRRAALNISFGDDPGHGNHDGVWGKPDDLWNLVSMGTTAKDTLRYADLSVSPVRLRFTNHDGAWGVKGHTGIFHGYLYHNCQCVDLEATLLDLPAGSYQALVYAHGDAPNQNARIQLVVGDQSVAQKATANDGTWQFRSTDFKEGVQYVSFTFDVAAGQPVKFISHRDGSGYSMFNALQIKAIADPSERDEEEQDREPLSRR